MSVRMEGTDAYLEGDWTVSHVEENMNSLLLSLRLVETSGARRITIDCGRIDEADSSGFQLLNVLMLCARLRGVEPKLVNMNDCMKLAIQKLKLRHCGSRDSCAVTSSRDRGVGS